MTATTTPLTTEQIDNLVADGSMDAETAAAIKADMAADSKPKLSSWAELEISDEMDDVCYRVEQSFNTRGKERIENARISDDGEWVIYDIAASWHTVRNIFNNLNSVRRMEGLPPMFMNDKFGVKIDR